MAPVRKQIVETLAQQIAEEHNRLDHSLRELRRQYGDAAVDRAQHLVDEQRQRQNTVAITPSLKAYRRHGE
jgi:hypothetical protein